MASPTFTKFYSFEEACREKKHDLSADTLQWVLSYTAPALTNTQLSDITQIANGNGYTTGGTACTGVTSTSSSGLYTLGMDDTTFTASGGSIAVFRWAILYNNTSVNDLLMGYLDYSYGITIATGQTFTIDIDATTGLYYAS